MTIHQAQHQLVFQLYHIYDNREAANIADWVMEHITGWKKIDRIVNKQVPLLPDTIALLQQYTDELLAHKPVQYVLNEAWFAGMQFYVNEDVLIPRPETEELVEWVVEGSRRSEVGIRKNTQPSDFLLHTSDLSILDIGTGSGCIPIALKKKLPDAQVYACDVSAGALAVASKNAKTLNADVKFLQVDFLDRASWSSLPQADIIVSNPPYIPENNKATMAPNVLQFEPHLALFVADNDPLLFYKAIAEFARSTVYVEIHEDLGAQTKTLFESKGFNSVEVKKDMQGKDRMVRAAR